MKKIARKNNLIAYSTISFLVLIVNSHVFGHIVDFRDINSGVAIPDNFMVNSGLFVSSFLQFVLLLCSIIFYGLIKDKDISSSKSRVIVFSISILFFATCIFTLLVYKQISNSYVI